MKCCLMFPHRTKILAPPLLSPPKYLSPGNPMVYFHCNFIKIYLKFIKLISSLHQEFFEILSNYSGLSKVDFWNYHGICDALFCEVRFEILNKYCTVH